MKKPQFYKASDSYSNTKWNDDLNNFFEMEMALVNSSKDHHLFLSQLEETVDVFERLRLQEKIDTCKEVYFEARERLNQMNPEKTCQIENEMCAQLPLQNETFDLM